MLKGLFSYKVLQKCIEISDKKTNQFIIDLILNKEKKEFIKFILDPIGNNCKYFF